MKELFLEFISFLRSPDRDSFSQSSFENQVIEVVKLFMMTFVAVIFLVMPLMSLIGADDLPNKLAELENLGFDHKWQQNLALFTLAVIAAPLIEEVIFRFPLKFRRGSIALFLVLIVALCVQLFQFLGMAFSEAIFIGLMLMVLIGLYLYFRLQKESALTEFTSKNYGYFFYAAALLFALAHIFNYELEANQYWMTPILVLPQMLLGLMLGYVRVKYGLWASILAHAMNNLIPTMAIMFMPEGMLE